MKESHKVRPSQPPWPRVMRTTGQPAGRSVRRGTTGLCIELRKHFLAEADELLSRVVFRGPGSGGVLQDSVCENFSFENKNDLVMAVESSPAPAR